MVIANVKYLTKDEKIEKDNFTVNTLAMALNMINKLNWKTEIKKILEINITQG